MRPHHQSCVPASSHDVLRPFIPARATLMHDLPHDHKHPHHHDETGGPGAFQERRAPIARDYRARAFTIGIGGPVGSGKTALLLALCRLLRDDYSPAVVTNDIFPKEGREVLLRHRAPPAGPISAVQTRA